MFGYAGNILHVDLSNEKFSKETFTEDFAKKYIGATGFGIKILLEHQKPGIDPLGPENVLIFSVGPVTGTLVPASGSKYGVFGKSPATGFIGEAYSTGFFGQELRRTGWDMIVIKGKAAKPVYLWIDDGSIQLMDAKHLWGKDIWETEETIKDEIGDFYVRVAAIGPAGEKLSRIAGIVNDRYRAAGRTGLGAVMGSKNLKAVAVRGSQGVKVANPEGFMEFFKELFERARGPATSKYRELGTPVNVLVLNELGALPTRNWQKATFEGAEKISGEYLNQKYVEKIVACGACPCRCEHIAIVDEGPYKGTAVRVEYQPTYALGSCCAVDRLDAVIKCIELCNRYGLDAISTGVVVSFAMECYEKGIINADGLDLKFGNHEAMVSLIEKIAFREGIGDILAEGVKIAAEKIGNGSENWAMHIKGLEMSGYDVRSLKTAALGYAVSRRGACHQRHGAYGPDVKGTVDRFKAEKGRGKIVMDMEDLYCIFDSFILCKFTRGIYDIYPELAKLYQLTTGIDMTAEELRLAGERITNMARLYNIREGLTRKDDHLPIRVMKDPIPEGVAEGQVVTQEGLDLMLDDYYETRGWTNEGVPTSETLKRLDLEDLHI